jgi:hypothetical protein
MSQSHALSVLSDLAAPNLGVFLGREAVAHGVSRKQLATLRSAGLVTCELPDTYRFEAAGVTFEQQLRAALLWAGDDATAAARRSAGWLYQLEGVRVQRPEIVVGRGRRLRSDRIVVIEASDFSSLMVRRHRGIRVTGIEATLTQLAAVLDAEALEIACEDARRRRLTSIPALQTYVDRFAHRGRRGVAPLRSVLRALDPVYPSRSTLEVKTRRLLVAHGVTGFVREFPLAWNGRTHYFDFAFERQRTILETNGRRWHDDPTDYEDDNEKWSVPGRHGYRLVFATWAKVTTRPEQLLNELAATLAA